MEKQDLIAQLIAGYEAAKKPIAFLLIFVAVAIETLPGELLPEGLQEATAAGVILALLLIILEILFVIYEKATEEEKRLEQIDSNDLYRSILDIVAYERNVSIKYIGVAGRHGWTPVLEKLLDENEPNSLIATHKKFQIDVALLDPNFSERNSRLSRMNAKFASVEYTSKRAQDLATSITEQATPGSTINVHYYDHMPNILGFLVNDNYLFTTYAFWERVQDELTLRAGGTKYFVYDKNDEFGGQEVIRRFQGWFDFIVESHKVGGKAD